jgi:hypothetical protein
MIGAQPDRLASEYGGLKAAGRRGRGAAAARNVGRGWHVGFPAAPRHPARSSGVRWGARRRGAELRGGLDETQQFLASLGYLHLRRLSLSEEGTQPLITARLGIHSVMVAVIGAVQSVVEDAYEVVVLVLGACGAFAEILHPVLLSDPLCITGQSFPL